MISTLVVAFLLLLPPVPFTETHWEAQDTYRTEVAAEERLAWLESVQCGPVGTVHECVEPVKFRATASRGSSPAVSSPHSSTPPPSTHGAGVEQWRTAVAQYSWNVDGALTVMNCESRGNPSATGRAGEQGLFQLKPELWALPGENLYDAATNIAAAFRLYSQGHPRAGAAPNWGHWVCQPDGSLWRFR